MSKEMLPEKLSRDQGLGPDPLPLVLEETNKWKRERLLLVFLMAVGIGILVLTSIVLLPHVNSLGSGALGGSGALLIAAVVRSRRLLVYSSLLNIVMRLCLPAHFMGI